MYRQLPSSAQLCLYFRKSSPLFAIFLAVFQPQSICILFVNFHVLTCFADAFTRISRMFSFPLTANLFVPASLTSNFSLLSEESSLPLCVSGISPLLILLVASSLFLDVFCGPHQLSP